MLFTAFLLHVRVGNVQAIKQNLIGNIKTIKTQVCFLLASNFV